MVGCLEFAWLHIPLAKNLHEGAAFATCLPLTASSHNICLAMTSLFDLIWLSPADSKEFLARDEKDLENRKRPHLMVVVCWSRCKNSKDSSGGQRQSQQAARGMTFKGPLETPCLRLFFFSSWVN